MERCQHSRVHNNHLCILQLSPIRVTMALSSLKIHKTAYEWNHIVSALFYLNSFVHNFMRFIPVFSCSDDLLFLIADEYMIFHCVSMWFFTYSFLQVGIWVVFQPTKNEWGSLGMFLCKVFDAHLYIFVLGS